MIQTKFNLDKFPPVERFDRWHDMVAHSLLLTTMQSPYRRHYHAAARTFDFSALTVSYAASSPLELHRREKEIQRSDPQTYQLSLVLNGTFTFDHAGRVSRLHENDIILHDSSKPQSAHVTAANELPERFVAQFPKALLPLPAKHVQPLVGACLSGRCGLGALLGHHLAELTRGNAIYRPSDDARLVSITTDLIGALLAHELDTDGSLPPDTRSRFLQTRIHSFIEENLGDPRLTPTTIAAAHQISLRYLQKLFREQDLSVAAWIRRRRLERCRHDLVNPALRDLPVRAICTRWGFSDSSHFSRLFRATYGTPPNDYRRMRHHDTT